MSGGVSEMSVAKLGKRGVVVLPAEIRKRSKISEGAELLIDISPGGIIYIMERPDNFVAALKEAGAGLWVKPDPLEHVQQEREKW